MKLHLGCGHINIPGFVHIDIEAHPHIDYARDVSDLSIFEDDSINLIYASHVLDYFNREQVPYVLAEWNRVLVPGGILQIAVRDFSKLASIYQKHGNLKNLLGYFYTLDEVNGKPIDTKNIFDFEYIKEILELAGFSKIKKLKSSELSKTNFADGSSAKYYPTPGEGILISLNIECQKPF